MKNLNNFLNEVRLKKLINLQEIKYINQVLKGMKKVSIMMKDVEKKMFDMMREIEKIDSSDKRVKGIRKIVDAMKNIQSLSRNVL